jgi:hypothetical protein
MGFDRYSLEEVMLKMDPEGEFESLNLGADGRVRRGHCPFCKHDSRSFVVSWKDDWYCTQCKEGGDLFEFSRRLHGFTYIECKEYFHAWLRHRPPEFDPSLSKLENEVLAARKLWDDSFELSGSVARNYFWRRAIPHDVYRGLENLRSCEIPFQDDGQEHMAIIAGIRDVHGELQGVQRTYLTWTGHKLCGPESRQCLGKIEGGAIILGDDRYAITLCVGLEEGLTHRLLEPARTVWVCADMKALTTLILPQECEQLYIAETPQMGELRSAHAWDTYSVRGRHIEIIKSRYGVDFNDNLTGIWTHPSCLEEKEQEAFRQKIRAERRRWENESAERLH